MKLTEEKILQVVESQFDYKLGEKTTCVLLKLKNGFEVVGTSACVDPKRYNHEIGIGYARKQAIDKVWELEGYLLHAGFYAPPESTGK